MKIDIFAHFMPEKYYQALLKQMGGTYPTAESNRGIIDLNLRLKLLDKYQVKEILVPTGPPPEAIASAEKSPELARIFNDSMAEIVMKHPDYFPGAVAMLPTNNIEAALAEIDRAIKDLKFKGIYVYTPQFIYEENQSAPASVKKDGPLIKGHTVGNLPKQTHPIDTPDLMRIYEKMAQYDLPIWIHPRTSPAFADYSVESASKYRVWQIFGWPYQSTIAMTRLVFSGIFDKCPNIKFIAHHAGAMVPIYEDRIKAAYDYDEMFGGTLKQCLKKDPVDYFRMFYTDTAVNGNTPALMAAHSFFNPGHLLFGTDTPHDKDSGESSVKDTILSIERMNVTETEKRAIFEDNVKNLLHL